eukprot:TRINITY_DN856_c0_g1_i1.p1 TRINITY_DN856_c0_g1~~TRINITY_DN856_c0_g1_i1.p1  ORF type:complete len:437 (-),score=114.26 TRINITY_DN856_c0_g1_i1:1305-2615(-)
MVKRVGRYEIGKTLGEGTFGKVKFATNTDTGEKVAIKVLDKEKIQKQNMGAQIKKEISIMKMVRHDHVVDLKEVLASRTKIFIVLELITGGELFDLIVSEGRFDEDSARYYFTQLVDGVSYCHGKGVCHRDLKPENLLLDERKERNLKISDFGLSALYSETDRSSLLHTTCGTPNYVAPEVLADKGYDGRAADVWSCGVILYVFLAGFLPFDEPTMSVLFQKIKNAEFTFPSWFSSEVRDLLNSILVPDPAMRPTLKDIRDHPWMTAGGDEPPKPRVRGGESEDEDYPEGSAIADVEEKNSNHHLKKPTDQPKLINAFDLVNMWGGLALNRLCSPADKKSNRQSQFMSSMSCNTLMNELTVVLEKLDCSVEVSTRSFKIRASNLTNHGMITVIIALYVITDDLHLVDVRRGKGDILEYNKFYQTLLDNIPEGMRIN